MKVIFGRVVGTGNRGDWVLTSVAADLVRSLCPDAEFFLLMPYAPHDPRVRGAEAVVQGGRAHAVAGLGLPWSAPIEKPLSPLAKIGRAASGAWWAVSKLLPCLAPLISGPLCRLPAALLPPAPRRVVRALLQADVVVMNPGTYIRLGSNIAALGSLLYAVLPALYARALRRPCLWLGQSFRVEPPPASPLSRRLLATALRGAAIVTVRDDFSARLCRDLAPDVPVFKTADLAWLYEPEPADLPAAARLPDQQRPRLGIVARVYKDASAWDAAADALAAAARWFIDEVGGWVYLWLQCTGCVTDGLDEHATEVVLEKIARPGRARAVALELSPAELMRAYGQMEMVISGRLHGALLALLAGTPALCIEYQGFKARDTFGPVGLGDWVFTLDDLKADRSALLRAAAKVWADLPAARQRTAHAVALGKAAAERNRELLRQAWESHVAGALSGSHADP